MITKTFHPIMEESNYENKRFAFIPAPEPGTEVILYASCSGKKLLISETPHIRPREIYKDKYDKKIIVDMHQYRVGFGNEYQSKDIGAGFIIEVEAIVNVTEADTVWRSGIYDVAQALEDEMDVKLRNIALQYDIEDIRALQQDLKPYMGEMYLVGTGITIQGIHYVVKLEKKQEELLRNKSYEKRRARTAGEIKGMYEDEVVAIFAEVADGAITPAEAMKQAKAGLSADFDERMRQIRVMTQYVEEIRSNDLAGGEQIADQMMQILGALPFSKQQNEREVLNIERTRDSREKIEQHSDIYKPFDD